MGGGGWWVAPGILLSALGLFRISILDSQSHSQSQSQSLDNFVKNHLLPWFNKNVLRIDPELVGLLVSGLHNHVEISFHPVVALGFNF